MAEKPTETIGAVSDVTKAARGSPWEQYVQMNVAAAVCQGLSQVPASLSWPEQAIADRALKIAKLVAKGICVDE